MTKKFTIMPFYVMTRPLLHIPLNLSNCSAFLSRIWNREWWTSIPRKKIWPMYNIKLLENFLTFCFFTTLWSNSISNTSFPPWTWYNRNKSKWRLTTSQGQDKGKHPTFNKSILFSWISTPSSRSTFQMHTKMLQNYAFHKRAINSYSIPLKQQFITRKTTCTHKI